MPLPSLCFRQATRARIAPSLGHSIPQRRFIQHDAQLQESVQPSLADFDALGDAMDELSNSRQRASFDTRPDSSFPAPRAQLNRPSVYYTDFKSNSFIKPSELKRENRITPPRPVSIRPTAPGRKESHYNDPLIQLKIDPRLVPENIQLLRWFVTDMGKIKRRAETGLSIRSQRMIGKAIKRARMMGLMPIFSRPAQSSRGSYL